MWASMFHLAIGNLFIGLFEAFLIRLCFHIRGKRLFINAVWANYTSSIVGAVLISYGSGGIIRWVGGPLPIYALGKIMVILAILSYLLTVFVEWPFYFAAMRKQATDWKRALRASILVNSASYLLLIGWYFMASSGPIDWGVKLVRPANMQPFPQARVLYFSPDGNSVMQMRLDGSAPSKLSALDARENWDALAFQPADRVNYVHLEVFRTSDPREEAIAEMGPCRVATRPSGFPWNSPYSSDDLQDSSARRWSLEGGFGYGGLWADDIATGSSRMIMSVDMPGLEWFMRSETILPDNQLVLELSGQIIWVDLSRNIAAGIAAGSNPVVVLDEPTTQP
jgi:hypothetical protein